MGSAPIRPGADPIRPGAAPIGPRRLPGAHLLELVRGRCPSAYRRILYGMIDY